MWRWRQRSIHTANAVHRTNDSLDQVIANDAQWRQVLAQSEPIRQRPLTVSHPHGMQTASRYVAQRVSR